MNVQELIDPYKQGQEADILGDLQKGKKRAKR